VSGANTKSNTDTTAITATASVRIVCPNRWAAASPSSRRSPTKIGMKGAARPLATITLKSSSGIRKAALNASSSPPMPKVWLRMRSRTSPRK
jgi:hypothetical protein